MNERTRFNRKKKKFIKSYKVLNKFRGENCGEIVDNHNRQRPQRTRLIKEEVGDHILFFLFPLYYFLFLFHCDFFIKKKILFSFFQFFTFFLTFYIYQIFIMAFHDYIQKKEITSNDIEKTVTTKETFYLCRTGRAVKTTIPLYIIQR